jgi:hypothetical protein
MTKYPQIKSQDIIWQDKLDSTSSVIENGGTFGSAAVIVEDYLELDGSTAWVNYGDLPLFHTILNEFSFSIWFRTTNTNIEYLLCKYLAGGNGSFYISKVSATRLDVAIELAAGKAQVTVSHATISDGEWHHIMGTYDGTTLSKYLDGVLVGSTGGLTGPLIQTSSSNFFVGSITTVSGFSFTGDLKKAKLFNKGLTAEEVLDEFQQDTFNEIDEKKFLLSLPLRSYYDAESDLVTDNEGSLGGSVTWGDGSSGATNPTQLGPKGITTDGTAEYLWDDGSYLTPLSSMQITGDVTFGALVRVNSVPASDGRTIMGVLLEGESLATNVLYQMYVNTDLGLGYHHEYGNGDDTGTLKDDFTTSLVIGVWAHIYMVRDISAQEVYLYKDGELLETFDYSAGLDPAGGTTSEFWIGVNVGYDPDRFTPISVIRPRVGDFAATPTQIKELHRRDMKGINK